MARSTGPTASSPWTPPSCTPSGRSVAGHNEHTLGLYLPDLDVDGTPGPLNALTDVPGVEVGMVTLISGDGPLTVGAGPVRTGVTAILPRGRRGLEDPCAAGTHVLNGNGEMTGTAWIDETGTLTSPILLTNTHAVGACHRGAIDWMNTHQIGPRERWHLPVVAETYDGHLNDINGDHITPALAREALDAARPGPFPLGSAGGGTGMCCYGFKGGTGTASRLVRFADATYTLAVLVQANFGARRELTLAHLPLGRLLRDPDPLAENSPLPPGAGSVVVIVATDAPLLPAQCAALARRVPLGLARTGTTGSHFSGDLFLSFSTANPGALRSSPPRAGTSPVLDRLAFIPLGHLDPFHEAAVQGVEEAVADALVCNAPMTGRDGHHVPALPHEQVIELLQHRPFA
ncbi:P1 family peptidase [Streptomyces sp. NPDC012421]|uniref:DmpA family aminopeptidase n=1 Tax=unclassified Streptomyces TaxID=2593676 RepID=UPI0036CDED4F